jgi:hypothetical protein
VVKYRGYTQNAFSCIFGTVRKGQDHHYANCGEAHPRQPLILKWLASSFLNDGFEQYGTHKEKQRSYEDNYLPWVMWEGPGLAHPTH